MSTALQEYVRFMAKSSGDKEHIVNTMAKPRPGFFEAANSGEGGAANFANVEQPYTSTSAFPWDNDSWYMN